MPTVRSARFSLEVLAATLIMLSPLGCRRDFSPDHSHGIAGTFQFKSGHDRVHGIDVLVLANDGAYFHYYRSLEDERPYTQTGKWTIYADKSNGDEVILEGFVPWGIEAWAGRGATLQNTQPSRTGMKIDDSGQATRLEVDPDIGSYFLKLR